MNLRLGIQLKPKSKTGGAFVPPPPPGDLWSDPATWASTLGHVPIAGDTVMLELGQTVYLDEPTAALSELHIEGTLIALPGSTIGITADLVMVMDGGELQIGTAASPFTGTCTITLTGARSTHTSRGDDNALDNDGMVRALMVEDGGTLCLHGAVPTLLKTKLNAHAAAAATTFTLANSVGWAAGDRIAISCTDFYGVGSTEQFTLASSTSGTAMATVGALTTPRWGVLQYPTDAGMSLTADTFTAPSVLTPTVLDQRAEVVNLSRKIIIQGANDTDWTSDGFGGHCMVMGVTSTAKVKGVEFRRMGQRRAMGRYPFHWHMLSYTSYVSGGAAGGVYIDDVVDGDHYLKDCAIWDSENRAVTIHGTCGVTVDNCYAVDIQGHAFFLEDGSEERNTLTDCVAMDVNDPGANRLKLHDELASGFWLTNPNNEITGNSASDCVGRGLWNSFANACFGLSRNVNLVPIEIVIDLYEDNTGHSCRLQGIVTNFIVTDEAGTATGEAKYLADLTPFTMSRCIIWKNGKDGSGFEGVGGYRNRVGAAEYIGWTAADNDSRDFAGQSNQVSNVGAMTQPAKMVATLCIGESLNDANTSVGARIAVASYHYEMNFIDMTFINYPFVIGTQNASTVYGGGAFDHSDLYVHTIGLGFYRNTGWKLINSSPGFLTPAPYFDGFPLLYSTSPDRYRYWSIAGAIWDPYGYWGTAGNYLLPSDDDFFTHGLSASTALEGGDNGLTTPDKFYGLSNIIVDTDDGDGYGRSLLTLKCRRFNSSMVEVGEHTIGDPDETAFFAGMRHFTIAKGGRYLLEFPDGELPTATLSLALANASLGTDSVLIGLPWDGTIPAAGRIDSGYYNGLSEAAMITAGRLRLLDFSTAANVADVLADTTGETAWQDTANDLVWILHVGGLSDGTGGAAEGSDFWLAQTQFVRLYEGAGGGFDGVGVAMAGNPDSFQITSSVIDGNGNYTICGLFKPTAFADNHCVVSLSASGSEYDAVYVYGGNWIVEAQGVAANGFDTGSAVSNGTTYHVTMRRNGSALDLLINGAVDASYTSSASGRSTITRMSLGQRGTTGGTYVIGEFGEWRAWTDAKSDGQIATEAASSTPVVTTNLYGEWQFTTGDIGNDNAAGGHDWTVNGSPTEVGPLGSPADGVGLLLNGTTDSLSLSSSLFDANAPYTVCWHGYVSSHVSFPNLFVVGSAFNANDTVQLTSGTIDAYVTASGTSNASGGSLSVGTRVHLALRRTSTTIFDVLINGAVVCSVTRDVSGRAATSFLRLGADWGNNGGSHVSGGLWEVRMWSTNLSDAEIIAEAASATVVRTANLVAEYSFVSGAVGTDESGNGHTLTVNGTPSEIPPV